MASRSTKPRLGLAILGLLIHISTVFSQPICQDCSQKVDGIVYGCKITQSCEAPVLKLSPSAATPPSVVGIGNAPTEFSWISEDDNHYLFLNVSFQIENTDDPAALPALWGFQLSLTTLNGDRAGSQDCALFQFDSDANLTQAVAKSFVFSYDCFHVIQPGSTYHLSVSSLPCDAHPWELNNTAASCNERFDLLYCNSKSATDWVPLQAPVVHNNDNKTATVEFKPYPSKFNVTGYQVLFSRESGDYSDCTATVAKSPALVDTSCLDAGMYNVTVKAVNPDCIQDLCGFLATEQLSISETTELSSSTITTSTGAGGGGKGGSIGVKDAVLSVLLVLISLAILFILFRILRKKEGCRSCLGLGPKEQLRTANNQDSVDTVPFCLNSSENATATLESDPRANGKPHIIYVPPPEGSAGDKRSSSGVAFHQKNPSPHRLAPVPQRGSYKRFLDQADDPNEEEDLVGEGGSAVMTPLPGFSGERQDSGFQDDDCYSSGVMDASSNLSIGHHHMTVPVDVHMPPNHTDRSGQNI